MFLEVRLWTIRLPSWVPEVLGSRLGYRLYFSFVGFFRGAFICLSVDFQVLSGSCPSSEQDLYRKRGLLINVALRAMAVFCGPRISTISSGTKTIHRGYKSPIAVPYLVTVLFWRPCGGKLLINYRFGNDIFPPSFFSTWALLVPPNLQVRVSIEGKPFFPAANALGV